MRIKLKQLKYIFVFLMSTWNMWKKNKDSLA